MKILIYLINSLIGYNLILEFKKITGSKVENLSEQYFSKR